MNNLNSVILEGNLVRDPEANLTPKGTPVCKFCRCQQQVLQAGRHQAERSILL